MYIFVCMHVCRYLALGIVLIFRAKKCAKKRLNVFDVFDSVVDRHPDKMAIIFNKQRWTFAQLQDFTQRVANFFSQEGFKEGDTISLFVHNCPEQIGMWVGLARIGVSSSLINYSLRKDVLLHSMGVTKPRAVVFSSALYPALSEVRADLSDTLGADFRFYSLDGPVEEDGVVDLVSELRNASNQPVKQREGKTFKGVYNCVHTYMLHSIQSPNAMFFNVHVCRRLFTEKHNTVCIQILAGWMFRKRPTPNNFRNFNFANGGLHVAWILCTYIIS